MYCHKSPQGTINSQPILQTIRVTNDAMHSKPRPVPQCRVLLPGEFNDTIPVPILKVL